MRLGAIVFVMLALRIMAPAVLAAAEERQEIVIEATALQPTVLRTTTEQRVTFVNRSGRAVHVEFHADGGQHRVFQVPGSIWAIFHRPGRHPYVVHFLSGGRDLHGAVDVEAGAAPGALPECTTISVMGVCIEP